MRDDTGRDGRLPLIGVNTVLPKDHGDEIATGIELIRSTEEEKGQQIANVQALQKARNALVPAGGLTCARHRLHGRATAAGA